MVLLELKGFIRNLSYSPQFTDDAPLKKYDFMNFDSNECSPFGLLQMDQNNTIAYTKWVSPKRTRSYPFSRLYHVFGTNSKIITIIPIIKDEGKDSMNNDRINAITFSWMNLLNIYIILAYYQTAEKQYPEKRRKSANIGNKRPKKQKLEFITNQKFDNDYIKGKIEEITQYKMSALHWNTKHFQDDFETIWNKAIECYETISREHNVKLHSFEDHRRRLEEFKTDGKFNIENFKQVMNIRSKEAQLREAQTTHDLEILAEGHKAIFRISNYLGGIYYLTCDETIIENDLLILQESKNSIKDRLPKNDDIRDGLFKLILFSNMDKLEYDAKPIKFKTRLKLTGTLEGALTLPALENEILSFVSSNQLEDTSKNLLLSLNKESEHNHLSIHIGSNKKSPPQPENHNPSNHITLDDFIGDE